MSKVVFQNNHTGAGPYECPNQSDYNALVKKFPKGTFRTLTGKMKDEAMKKLKAKGKAKGSAKLTEEAAEIVEEAVTPEATASSNK